jgi:hypothetical protein
VESGTAIGTFAPRLVAREEAGIRREAEPVTVGLPLPRGRVRVAEGVALRDPNGDLLPVQAEIVDRWSDGSARWMHLDFPVTCEARGEVDLRVELDAERGPEPSPALEVRETERGVFVDTGAATFALDAGAFGPFRSVRAGGVELVDPAASGLRLETDDGVVRTAVVRRLEVERRGPLAAVVRAEGVFDADGSRGPLVFTARFRFAAGRATLRLDLTVRNPHRAAHPGGHWELGDAGSVLVRDLSLTVAAAGTGEARVSWSAGPSAPLAVAPGERVEIYQDSSGGPHWRSRVHLTRDRAIPVSFRGYRIRAGGEERTGERATPRVAAHDGALGVGASVPRFWQEFPKALVAGDRAVTVRLFPGQFAALHEIQGGEQKTHRVVLHFGEEAVAAAPDGERAPLLVHPDPATYVDSGAIPYLSRREGDPNRLWHALTDQAIEGPDTFEHKRERVDEYGWRHFGEIWADHESKFHDGDGEFVSHYNNQYDVVYGAFLQFARTGDARWFRIFDELARHVVDIDIYHTDEDKPAYNRGLFWHTVHYVDADLSTHRSYPRKGSPGGGPDNEHNYTTGLMHWWLAAGEADGRATAIDSARWVVAADDPDGTPLRRLDRSPTGLASKTRDFDFHGPGRGVGNSINALVDGWRLTGDRALLGKCEELILRTVHPDDDPESMNLLDSENRWSYTVCLQALGKYLDAKAEAGEIDEMYGYAQATLLAYARWMAEREKRTLDDAENLDHPTETWAAQDVRKADVLLHASLHARGEEREALRQRALRFWDEALEQLDSFPTRSYMRPVIVLMHYGHLKAWLDRHPDDERPPGPEVRPAPREPFVPQKLRAVAKLKRIVLAAGAVGAVVVAIGLYLMLS